jgi:hypothetical protein
MSTFNCEYCHSVFKNSSSLKLHQKKAKYCIKIQKENNEMKVNCNNILNNKFKCENCDKLLSSKRNLDNHYSICNNIDKLKVTILKYKIHIEELIKKGEQQEKKIKELENTIERLAINAIHKPTTTNNNTTNNTLNIMSSLDFNNVNKIKNLIDDNYNINYAIDGQKGLARFVVDNLLKDENGELLYVCTDPSRQIFKYKDDSGEIKKDVEAKKLTNYIVDGGIKKKTIDVSNEWYTDDKGGVDTDKFNIMIERQQNILKLQDDNSSFKKELATITIK